MMKTAFTSGNILLVSLVSTLTNNDITIGEAQLCREFFFITITSGGEYYLLVFTSCTFYVTGFLPPHT